MSDDSAVPAGAAAEPYCSRRQTHSSMLGSAEQVDLWLLIEARGNWPAQAVESAFTTSPMAAALDTWLAGSLAALAEVGIRARPQLIKQSSSAGTGRRLFIGFASHLYALTLEDDALAHYDLPALVAALRAGTANLKPLSEPQYFVCTNGRRDQCCSRYGMPVYRQLRALVGERAWQTSHVGGHRFAPNVLTLPDGVLYGRVTLEDCAGIVEAASAGDIYFKCLRGRSAYSATVQAAEGMLATQGLKLLHVSESELGHAVEFAAPKERCSVVLKRSEEPELVLAGCEKTALKAYHPFTRTGP